MRVMHGNILSLVYEWLYNYNINIYKFGKEKESLLIVPGVPRSHANTDAQARFYVDLMLESSCSLLHRL